MPKKVIRLSALSFRYPESSAPILDDISFSVRTGERLVISGPSGCGKSTLLYLLNRLYPFNCDGIVSGELWLFEKNSVDYAPGEINQRIATVFQDPDTQFCMPSVEEELAFTLENLRVPSTDMEERIADVLEITALTSHRHSKIHTLSGGMKQRVAIACALVMKPDLLLLDEPMAHLDPLTAKNFVQWLDDLQQTLDLTIIAVEHRLANWDKFFTREICLDQFGKLIADRAPIVQQQLEFPKYRSAIKRIKAVCVNDLAVTIASECCLLPLSFTLNSGEVTIIAGPNGSGKTTLLKALAGILRSSGSIKASSQLGYVPQSPEFMFLTPTVAQELAYSEQSSPIELANLMERLDLFKIAESHPFAVSHGQKRRVAIGAMLADKRNVLLMDEPTAGQDADSLNELYNLIRARAADGAAFLIVTHDMDFAAAIADSVLLLKDGALTGKLAAADLWHQQDVLLSHQLLPPKGEILHEAFIT